MQGSNMHFEVIPPIRDEITGGIGAVKSKEDERFLHHFLGLERDSKFGILERYIIGSIIAEGFIGIGGEDYERLRMLQIEMMEGDALREGGRTLQYVQSIRL
jgi:hypothetical protein